MKTTFDIVNVIYEVLSNANLGISGGVYKRRPAGSIQEDVVIGSLPINNEQIQQAVININVHIPNVTVVVNGVQDNTQPNSKRLNEVTKLVIDQVNEKYFADHWCYVQQQNVFEDDLEHYSNIRLNYYNIN